MAKGDTIILCGEEYEIIEEYEVKSFASQEEQDAFTEKYIKESKKRIAEYDRRYRKSNPPHVVRERLIKVINSCIELFSDKELLSFRRLFEDDDNSCIKKLN